MEPDAPPSVIAETDSFAVVFKPPRMHCAPLERAAKGSAHAPSLDDPAPADGNGTLLDWYAALFPAVMDVKGKKKGEGGLLHRLDFETHGVVLFAKNQKAFDALDAQQTAGGFVKEYSAFCKKGKCLLPQPPLLPPGTLQRGDFAIESFFRPYGDGRKQVRPVAALGWKDAARGDIARDRGDLYRTEILGAPQSDSMGRYFLFTARITRGFRHQIRCHLAWIGYPIRRDPVYGNFALIRPKEFIPSAKPMGLRASAISFSDPETGEQIEVRIPSLELPAVSL